MQASIDDLLFLGRDYDECFDRFEVLLALAHGHFHKQEAGYFWAPVGRFAWKARRGHGEDPLARILSEARTQGSEWEPLRAGLFPAPFERLEEIAADLSEAVAHLPWF